MCDCGIPTASVFSTASQFHFMYWQDSSVAMWYESSKSTKLWELSLNVWRFLIIMCDKKHVRFVLPMLLVVNVKLMKTLDDAICTWFPKMAPFLRKIKLPSPNTHEPAISTITTLPCWWIILGQVLWKSGSGALDKICRSPPEITWSKNFRPSLC